MQKGDPTGRILYDVLHENPHTEPRMDLRIPNAQAITPTQ